MGNAQLRRNKQIAAIHAAKRDLGMDEDTYRNMLEKVTGKRSSAGLSYDERQKVLDYLRESGAKRTPKKRVAQHPGRPANIDTRAQLQKIEALLADMSLSWKYADAIARQQTGIARVAWLKEESHLRSVIAALHVEQEKRGLFSQVEQHARAADIDLELLAEQFDLPKGWQRNRKILENLIEGLHAHWPLDTQQEG